MIPFANLREGAKYRVTYRIPGVQRVDRVCVMSFGWLTKDETFWSLRPLAGTQQLSKKWIKDMVRVDDSVPKHLPRKA